MSAEVNYIKSQMEKLLEASLYNLKNSMKSRDSRAEVLRKYGICQGYDGGLSCCPGPTYTNKSVMEYIGELRLDHMDRKEMRAIEFPEIEFLELS